MPATLYARNLPADVGEEDIRRALEHHGQITSVEFMADANTGTDRKVAMITMDVPLFEAEVIAEKFNGRIVRGQPITLYAAMHN